jgi:DNA-binding NtrC family response regulator
MKQHRANILFVADHTEQMDLLMDALKSMGHFVDPVVFTDEAMTRIVSQSYDILIADISLPGMDNVFHQSVKQRFPDLPIILITGPAEPAIIRTADKNGVVSRPFRISHIEELIHNLLGIGLQPDVKPSRGDVLVVDDDDTFRTMLIRSLTLSGYNARGASDGRMAVELLENGGIGTVIADINMPYMDGITLMNKIRRQWPDIPVVLITGYYSTSESTSRDSQPDGFLMKPFKIKEIDRLLQSISAQKPEA